jgi:hypothetical protein
MNHRKELTAMYVQSIAKLVQEKIYQNVRNKILGDHMKLSVSPVGSPTGAKLKPLTNLDSTKPGTGAINDIVKRSMLSSELSKEVPNTYIQESYKLRPQKSLSQKAKPKAKKTKLGRGIIAAKMHSNQAFKKTNVPTDFQKFIDKAKGIKELKPKKKSKKGKPKFNPHTGRMQIRVHSAPELDFNEWIPRKSLVGNFENPKGVIRVMKAFHKKGLAPNLKSEGFKVRKFPPGTKAIFETVEKHFYKLLEKGVLIDDGTKLVKLTPIGDQMTPEQGKAIIDFGKSFSKKFDLGKMGQHGPGKSRKKRYQREKRSPKKESNSVYGKIIKAKKLRDHVFVKNLAPQQ